MFENKTEDELSIMAIYSLVKNGFSGSTDMEEDREIQNPMCELFYGQYRAEGINEGTKSGPIKPKDSSDFLHVISLPLMRHSFCFGREQSMIIVTVDWLAFSVLPLTPFVVIVLYYISVYFACILPCKQLFGGYIGVTTYSFIYPSIFYLR
jgi:hypothetical protein